MLSDLDELNKIRVSVKDMESAADIFGAPSEPSTMVISSGHINDEKEELLKSEGWIFTKEIGGCVLPDGTEIEIGNKEGR